MHDPKKFYTAVPKGQQTMTKTFRLTVTASNLVDQLCYNTSFPHYKTPGDFLRDAVEHRLKQLADMDEDDRLGSGFQSEMRALDLANSTSEVQKRAALGEQARRFLLETRTAIEEAHRHADWVLVTHIRNAAADALESTPEPYDEQLLGLILEWTEKIEQAGHGARIGGNPVYRGQFMWELYGTAENAYQPHSPDGGDEVMYADAD